MFILDQEHLELQASFKEFAENEVKPLAKELDETGRFPSETVAKLGEMGMMGLGDIIKSLPTKFTATFLSIDPTFSSTRTRPSTLLRLIRLPKRAPICWCLPIIARSVRTLP